MATDVQIRIDIQCYCSKQWVNCCRCCVAL